MNSTVNTKGTTLKQHSYEALKRMILEGEYMPGTFLSERGISERLSISITPIRYALQRLELERLVIISPQQGVVVREIPPLEINNISDVRIAMEVFMVNRLLGDTTPAQIAKLEDNLDHQLKILDSKTKEESEKVAPFVELDVKFHHVIYEMSNNREMANIMGSLAERIQRLFVYMLRQSPTRMTAAFAEHKKIVEYLASGETEDCVRLIETHIINGRNILLGV